MREAIRFFRIVRPFHPLTGAAFGAALGIAAAVVIFQGRHTAEALAPVFLVQMLATSSGFAGPARRGHYDYLFTNGHSRLAIGVAHWVISAAPGLASWVSLAAIELVASRSFDSISLAPGTIVGMVLVSTLPWAATVALPRLTGGLAWALLLVMTFAVWPPANRAAAADGTAGAQPPVTRVLTVLTSPWTLAGDHLEGGTALPALVAIVIAAAAMAAALRWIHRADVPLEAAQ